MQISSGGSSIVRAPRLKVLANGELVSNVIEVEVLSNSYTAADRFSITAASNDVSAAGLLNGNAIAAEIEVSLDDGGTWASITKGDVDTVLYDPITGTVNWSGRDQIAILVETRTQENFTNQTASDVVGTIATRHNFGKDIVPTTALVGRYWELQHDAITLAQHGKAATEWDLLASLAQHEGFDVWASNGVLHFRPPESNPAVMASFRAVTSPYGLPNVTGMRFERTLNLSGPVRVTVRSWNSRLQQSIEQSAASAGSLADTNAPVSEYVLVIPNLTVEAANQVALRRLAELSRQHKVVDISMPGETELAPRMHVQVEGTSTDFDDVYVIEEIVRRLNRNQGFTEYIRATTAGASG